MKIPVQIAQKILQLSKGDALNSSVARHAVMDELIAERIVERTGRIQKKLQLVNRNALLLFLQNKYGINDLEKYVEISLKNNVQRSDLVEVSSYSKLKNIRTFKGFLINSYVPTNVILNGNEITLNFTEGIFQFIYDFENFIPNENVTIIGIENAENFRWIAKQKYLFKDIEPLFVSRYPQSQSKDLVKWLQSIPNNYLHFGDFDFAGIGIYLNEFKKHLLDKATFFIPENIEKLVVKHGNKTNYDRQKINFKIENISEEKLIKLVKNLHQYKCGLEQEIFIKKL